MQETSAVLEATGVPAPARVREGRERLAIFAVALILRLAAGALFFGSVDMINSAENSIKLLQGEAVYLPYFPTINALLWFGGVLAAATPIPFSLGFKLVPILFDALLAVLIRDLVARSSPRLALRTGLLYAASPVALLVTSFHGQWDSIALFFLLLAFAVREDATRPRGNEFVFGALFGVGLLVKPIGLTFATLIPRRKGEAGSYWPAALGFLLTLAGAFAVYEMSGYSVIQTVGRIVWYSRGNFDVFGLPYLPALASVPLRENRLLWIVPVMGVLAILYHRRRLTATDAMLVFYLFSLGTAGIAPQYLVWPVPLLLISGRLRFASIYTAVATAFLLLFYANPWATYEHYSNVAVFAPLRAAAWLAPPRFITRPELLALPQALGDLLLPACVLTMAIFVLCRPEVERPIREGAGRWMAAAAWYASPVLPIAAIVALTRLGADNTRILPRLLEAWRTVPLRYAVHVHRLNPPTIFSGDFGASSPFNVVVLLALLGAVWCLAAAWIGGRSREDARSREIPAPGTLQQDSDSGDYPADGGLRRIRP
ncbi:MAG: hypothetical protein ABSF98_23640 [Bryobacteraceae bacterium]|jgi:hypothetical protein